MLPEKFWSRVSNGAPDECWEWQGATNGRYGKFAVKIRGTRRSRMFYAHRKAWELANDERVPPGMEVCHSCDNPMCCNPAHLWVGTRKQNMEDMVAKGRNQAGEGHHRARVSDAEVDQIRLLANDPEMTGRSLAARFGVSPTTVSRIVRGKQRPPRRVQPSGTTSLADSIGESLSVVGSVAHPGRLVPETDSSDV